MNAPSSRPPRARRPPVPTLPDFHQLDHAHRAALDMLQAFERLLTHLEAQGLDAVARRTAREVLDFFSGPGLDHHAQEETLVFPGLLNCGDAELAHHVRRLQQDHGWIEEDWRELAPHVQAVAEGYNGYDLPLLRAALPVFGGLYQEHIALEEGLVYPAARRLAQALKDGSSASQTAA